MFIVVVFLFTTGAGNAARAGHHLGVPILMYHVIAAAPTGVAFPNLFVRPEDFAAQMMWLAAHGYHAVTLHRVYEYWADGQHLPRRPIVISFDDGTLGQATHALPVLQSLGWPGVLNLKVAALASPDALPAWRVCELLAAGWELDAHTLTHPDLTRLDDAELWHQVHGSRVELQNEFHVPVDFFCYPAAASTRVSSMLSSSQGFSERRRRGTGWRGRSTCTPSTVSAPTARTASRASRRSCRV
jgi:peptidoglycan/xylan/chitin deacetylase (PgdA/CDA1 family)